MGFAYHPSASSQIEYANGSLESSPHFMVKPEEYPEVKKQISFSDEELSYFLSRGLIEVNATVFALHSVLPSGARSFYDA